MSVEVKCSMSNLWNHFLPLNYHQELDSKTAPSVFTFLMVFRTSVRPRRMWNSSILFILYVIGMYISTDRLHDNVQTLTTWHLATKLQIIIQKETSIESISGPASRRGHSQPPCEDLQLGLEQPHLVPQLGPGLGNQVGVNPRIQSSSRVNAKGISFLGRGSSQYWDQSMYDVIMSSS